MKYSDEELESIIDRMKGLLGEYDKADDAFKRGQWHDHFAEKLDPYCDKLKALNGPDFDLYKESFDEYSKDFSDLEADDYVTKLVENIDALLDKLRGALGEDKVELESGPEGTEVVSHEDKGIEANAEEQLEEKPEEEMTSDARAKKMAGWKSPSKSGGRDGHTGIPGSYKSDEDTKEKPEGEIKDVVKDAAELAEHPVAKTVEEVVVKPLTEEPDSAKDEGDELTEFIKDLEKYPKAK